MVSHQELSHCQTTHFNVRDMQSELTVQYTASPRGAMILVRTGCPSTRTACVAPGLHPEMRMVFHDQFADDVRQLPWYHVVLSAFGAASVSDFPSLMIRRSGWDSAARRAHRRFPPTKEQHVAELRFEPTRGSEIERTCKSQKQRNDRRDGLYTRNNN